MGSLPISIQEYLNKCKAPDSIPFLDLISVKKALRTTKHTLSQLPDDMPPNITQEFYEWLPEPYLDVLKMIVNTGRWSSKWK